jgi:small-conductance mechanosensitive channel
MWRARTAVIEAVTDAYENEGIKIPFPQRELMGRTEEGGFAIAEGERPASAPTPDGGEGGDADD